MKASQHARDAIAALLRVELPRRVALLRVAWNLDEDTLPEPYVHSGEPASDALTSVTRSWVNVENPRDLAPMRRVDIDRATGSPIYELRHNANINTWILGADWPTAQSGRDYLTAAVRDVLIEYPTLTIGEEDTGFALHPDTLTIQYGGLMRSPAAGSGRVWAPALISCDMRSESSLVEGSSQTPPHPVDGVAYSIEGVPVSSPMPRRSNDPPLRYPTNL